MFKSRFFSVCFGLAAALLLAACTVSAALAKPLPKASSREDYPELPPMCSALSLCVDFTFEEYVNCSQLVVDATVKGKWPGKFVPSPPKAASLDQTPQEIWRLKDHLTAPYYVELTINDVWIGSVESSSIILKLPDYAHHLSPIFYSGSRVILFLEPDSTEDQVYIAPTSNGSLYYVADDQKIYPAFLSTTLTGYSGKKLYQFKQNVRDAWEPQRHEPED